MCLEQQKHLFCEKLGGFPHLGLKGFALGVTFAFGANGEGVGGGTGGTGGGGGVVPGTPGGSSVGV